MSEVTTSERNRSEEMERTLKKDVRRGVVIWKIKRR